MERKIQKNHKKDKMINGNANNKYNNIKDIEYYIEEQTKKKLNLVSNNRHLIVEAIDSPVQRAIVSRERTIKNRSLIESKKVVPKKHVDIDIPINLKAKIYNDSEF
jgi:hypothetical protein